MKMYTFFAAAALMAIPAMNAHAVTNLDATDSGGTFDLLADDGVFNIDGPGLDFGNNTGVTDLDWTFTIDASEAPQPGVAGTVNLIFNGTVEGLEMNWASGNMAYDGDPLDGDGIGFNEGDATVFKNAVFNFVDIGGGFTLAQAVLPTVFRDPDRLSQTLNFGFASFKGDNFSVSIDVAAVPLPASLLLFLSALGGLGFVSTRRRKVAAA